MCVEATNFLARATGITVAGDITNYTNLICGLVTDGVWAKLDALYIFSAPDVATAKLNLISSSFTITSHGTNIDTTGFTAASGGTFSAASGFTGNGSDRYLDTGCAPSAGLAHYSQFSASFGAYAVTSITSDSGNPIIIGSDTAVLADLLATVNNPIARINSIGPSITWTNTNQRGFYILTSTADQVQALYKNGTSVGSGTWSNQVVTTLPAFFVLARNSSGSPDLFWNNQVSVAFIGGGLSATDATNFTNRINTFMLGPPPAGGSDVAGFVTNEW